MPRRVRQGEPQLLGRPPYHRRAGDLCLVLVRDPATGAAVPAAMRWGMSTAPDPHRRVLQVRADQLRSNQAALRLRCLVPIDGYVQRGVGKSRVSVAVAADTTVAVAAIWADEIAEAAFAIITTEANVMLAPAHARMPVLLPPALWPRWLDKRPLGASDLEQLNQPAPPSWLRARPLPRGMEEGEARPVTQQVQEWAPGSALWQPKDQPPPPEPPEIRRAAE